METRGDLQHFAKGTATDIVIVGAGPAGLLAAACLARYGVSFRLIDRRPIPVLRGHAAGLQPRTAEIMHSLGLQHDVAKYGNTVGEISFWSGTASGLKRSGNSPETEVTNATPYPYVTYIHQGHTESLFIDDLASRGISVDRPVKYVDHNESGDIDYPIYAYLKDEISGMVEELPTKYI